jgi:hypothetical protein
VVENNYCTHNPLKGSNFPRSEPYSWPMRPESWALM